MNIEKARGHLVTLIGSLQSITLNIPKAIKEAELLINSLHEEKQRELQKKNPSKPPRRPRSKRVNEENKNKRRINEK
jgi:hypothetical protein